MDRFKKKPAAGGDRFPKITSVERTLVSSSAIATDKQDEGHVVTDGREKIGLIKRNSDRRFEVYAGDDLQYLGTVDSRGDAVRLLREAAFPTLGGAQ